MEPWVHYIPIKPDFSDLEDKMQWLETHDEEAKEIADNAYEFMLLHREPEQMQCYAGLAMLEYVRLYHLGE